MWLTQGGALKIENLQFTQYSILILARSYTQSISHSIRSTHTHTHTERGTLTKMYIISHFYLV